MIVGLIILNSNESVNLIANLLTEKQINAIFLQGNQMQDFEQTGTKKSILA